MGDVPHTWGGRSAFGGKGIAALSLPPSPRRRTKTHTLPPRLPPDSCALDSRGCPSVSPSMPPVSVTWRPACRKVGGRGDGYICLIAAWLSFLLHALWPVCAIVHVAAPVRRPTQGSRQVTYMQAKQPSKGKGRTAGGGGARSGVAVSGLSYPGAVLLAQAQGLHGLVHDLHGGRRCCAVVLCCGCCLGGAG